MPCCIITAFLAYCTILPIKLKLSVHATVYVMIDFIMFRIVTLKYCRKDKCANVGISTQLLYM